MNETVVEASRTILFDTHSRMGLDFGILFAWIAVSFAFFPIANRIMSASGAETASTVYAAMSSAVVQIHSFLPSPKYDSVLVSRSQIWSPR